MNNTTESIDLLLSPDIKKTLDSVTGFIGFSEIGLLFNFKGEEVEFFKSQILVDGLRDFHITTAPNISDEQKREAVRETIRLWDVEGELITEL